MKPPGVAGSPNGAVGNDNSMLVSNDAEKADVEKFAPAFLNEKNSILPSSLETAPHETQNTAAAQTLDDNPLETLTSDLTDSGKVSQKFALPKIPVPKPAEVRLSQPSENIRKRASVVIGISSSDEASCADGDSSSDAGSSYSYKSENATKYPLHRPPLANIQAPSQKIN